MTKIERERKPDNSIFVRIIRRTFSNKKRLKIVFWWSYTHYRGRMNLVCGSCWLVAFPNSSCDWMRHKTNMQQTYTRILANFFENKKTFRQNTVRDHLYLFTFGCVAFDWPKLIYITFFAKRNTVWPVEVRQSRYFPHRCTENSINKSVTTLQRRKQQTDKKKTK